MRKNLKIRSTNFEVVVGNVTKNKETIKELVREAEKDGVDILSLPELSLVGASFYDGYRDIVEKCEEAILDLVEFSKDIKVIFTVGFPLAYNNKIYNAVIQILDGGIIAITSKKNLKNIEKSVFSDDMVDNDLINALETWPDINLNWSTINGLAINVTIGEDELMPIPRSLVYNNSKEGFHDIILNPSAEAKLALSEEEILNRVKFLSKDVTYVYTSSGSGESTTDYVYSGLNIIAHKGEIKAQAVNCPVDFVGKYYLSLDEESWFFKDFKAQKTNIDKFPYLPDYERSEKYVADVLDIAATGFTTRMKHIGVRDTFIGVSGGLDSTMALLFLVNGYHKEGWDLSGIHAYTMPAFGTSDRTKSNAFKLCEALGLVLNEIDISEAVTIHLRDIGHDGKTPDAAYENAQARERTQILFDLANMHNGIVIGTGDLSENMQGFATYNGDHMSNYSLNATLMKTEIRYIVGQIAENTENIELKNVLTDILDTPISPELVAETKGEISQKTEEIIGPYELIDFFIYKHMTEHLSSTDILEEAIIAFADTYDEATIRRWLISYFKRFTSSQFKRSAAVDGPNITGRSFSARAGFKIASDVGSAVYIEDLDEK